MLCFLRSPKRRTRQLIVLTVVEAGHTMPKLGVLLRIESAIPVKDTAITIFNSSTSQASARIENWRLKLQSFNFEVSYSRGDLNPADYISRHLQSDTKYDLIAESAEQYVKFVMSQATPKALGREEIIEATRKDVTLQEVMRLISTGQWDDLKPVEGVDSRTLKTFANVRDELTSVDGNLILRGSRIVIPDALQKQVVELAHEGHQGLVKTRTLLRSKVWFPRMDSLVDSIVKRCVPCQVATPKPSREPLQMTPLPSGPWEQVSIDFCEVAGHYVLVVVDDYSRFPEIEIVHSTSAKAVIPKLDRIFAAYGVPQVVKSDNGPPFNGGEFAQFAKYIGFKHRKVSPLWPRRTGNKICISSFATIVPPPIVPQVLPLLPPCLVGLSEPSYPTLSS